MLGDASDPKGARASLHLIDICNYLVSGVGPESFGRVSERNGSLNLWAISGQNSRSSSNPMSLPKLMPNASAADAKPRLLPGWYVLLNAIVLAVPSHSEKLNIGLP